MDAASVWPVRQIRQHAKESAHNKFSCQNKNIPRSLVCLGSGRISCCRAAISTDPRKVMPIFTSEEK
jgi:hypothetical protein